ARFTDRGRRCRWRMAPYLGWRGAWAPSERNPRQRATAPLQRLARSVMPAEASPANPRAVTFETVLGFSAPARAASLRGLTVPAFAEAANPRHVSRETGLGFAE